MTQLDLVPQVLHRIVARLDTRLGGGKMQEFEQKSAVEALANELQDRAPLV